MPHRTFIRDSVAVFTVFKTFLTILALTALTALAVLWTGCAISRPLKGGSFFEGGSV